MSKELTKMLLTSSLVFSFVGCSADNTPSASSEKPSSAVEPTGDPVAEVTGGKIRGYVDDNGVKIFKGIPFAATTEGENRFKDPQPVVAWEGEKDCTQWGPICPQNDPAPFMCWSAEYVDGGYTLANGKMSEDCLNLNVWTTANEGENQPVIVYIHGGANTSGSGQNEVYTGEKIAQKGAVYVTINYRVGLYGFLTYEDESGETITGNFAIKDQIAALEWVKNNIAKFGGDPNNVTISGQSAGSADVQKLMISPKAAGLFQHAVAMSANSYEGFGPMSGVSVESARAEAAEKLAGKTVADLRALSTVDVDALRAEYNPSSMLIDGEYLLDTQKGSYESGNFNHVDFMTGCVTGDTMLFGGFVNLPEGEEAWTAELYEAAIREKLGDQADTFLALYPAGDDVAATVAEIGIDHANAQYTIAIAAKDSKDGENNSYQWYFSRPVPDADPAVQAQWGAFHTGDVGYWLNYFSDTSKRPWEQADFDLGDLMSSYFVNFAKTGDPNGAGLPEWKKSDGTVGYMNLDAASEYKQIDSAKSDFWKSYYAD